MSLLHCMNSSKGHCVRTGVEKKFLSQQRCQPNASRHSLQRGRTVPSSTENAPRPAATPPRQTSQALSANQNLEVATKSWEQPHKIYTLKTYRHVEIWMVRVSDPVSLPWTQQLISDKTAVLRQRSRPVKQRQSKHVWEFNRKYLCELGLNIAHSHT